MIGIIISLVNNFNPSAKGCNNPYTPTTLKNESSCLVALYHGVHLCPDNTDEYWHLLCRGNVICAKVWYETFLK